jgi:hypothetical protein
MGCLTLIVSLLVLWERETLVVAEGCELTTLGLFFVTRSDRVTSLAGDTNSRGSRYKGAVATVGL